MKPQKHPAPSTQHPAPSTQHPAPSTQHLLIRSIKICFLVNILLANFLNGQNQLKHWVVPPYLIDFTTNSTSMLPAFAPTAAITYNSVYLPDGTMDFYVNNNIVDAIAGGLTFGLTSLPPCNILSYNTNIIDHLTEIPIVPVPGSNSRYYIVLPGDYLDYDECYDLSGVLCNNLNNYWVGIPAPPDIILNPPLRKRNNFAVTPEFIEGGNPKRLLFVYMTEKDQNANGPANIMVYEITNSGIVQIYKYDIRNNNSLIDNGDYTKTELECISLGNGDYRIATCVAIDKGACSIPGGLSADLDYMLYTDNFHYASGNITESNFSLDFLPESDHTLCSFARSITSGLEFSPDGSKIYFTMKYRLDNPTILPQPNHYIYYYDFNTSSFNALFASSPLLNERDFRFSFIETAYAPDNATNSANQRIYFNAGNRLAYLSDPNNPNPSNFVDNAVLLSPPVQICHPFNYLGVPGDNSRGNVFILPDQIDQENYDNFLGTLTNTITSSAIGVPCNGNGAVTLTASNGFNSYLWNTGATTQSISVSAPGTYTVTVEYFCSSFSATSSYTIVGTIIADISAVIDGVGCSANDGAIDLTITGSTGPYTFNWQPGNYSTEDISGLSQGDYIVVITDSYGCTRTERYTVGNACCDNFVNNFPANIDIYDGMVISGNYNLNSDVTIPQGFSVTLDNCTITVARGVKISVLQGAELTIINQSYLYACGAMWRGIFAYPMSRVITDGIRIDDADQAIFFLEQNTGLIRNSIFDNNIVGIETGEYDPIDRYHYSFKIHGNTFSHSTALKPRFIGQRNNTGRPFAGVSLHNFTSALIGMGNSNDKNTFTGAEYGIYASNFDELTCYNNQIYSWTNGIYCYSENPGSMVNIRPWYGQTNTNLSIYSKFGIRLNHVSASVEDMIVKGVNGIIVENTGFGNHIEIDKNKIYGLVDGIKLDNTYGADHVIVNNNDIYNGFNFSGFTCIEAFGNVTDGRSNLEITGNRLNLNNYWTGIYLGFVHYANISNNHINGYYNGGGNIFYGSMIGIHLSASNNNTISCNEINALNYFPNDPGEKHYTSGITVDVSYNNRISCNTLDGMYAGIVFNGVCGGTDLKGNSFGHHFEGLRLGSNAVIDFQVRKANEWLDPAAYGNGLGFGAINNNIGPGLLASKFNVSSASAMGTKFYPKIPTGQPSEPTNNSGWFLATEINNGQTCLQSYECQSQSAGNGNELTATDYLIAQGGELSIDWPTETRAQAEQYLFNKLSRNDSLLLVDTVFQNFYDSHQNLAIGQLNHINNGIGQMGVYASSYTNDILVMNAALRGVNDSIYILDSLIMALGNNAQYTNDRANLLIQKNNLTNTIAVLNNQLEALQNGQAANLIAENAGISGTDAPKLNERAVNEIYLSTLAVGITAFTSEQTEVLLSIGQQCPFVGGQAVIRARNMYRQVNENMVYDDYNNCLAQGVYRTPQQTSRMPVIQRIVLKPNPANTEAEIYFQSQISDKAKIILRENTGRVVLSKLINESSFPFILQISQFANGLYFVEAYQGNSLIAIEKLSIIH